MSRQGDGNTAAVSSARWAQQPLDAGVQPVSRALGLILLPGQPGAVLTASLASAWPGSPGRGMLNLPLVPEGLRAAGQTQWDENLPGRTQKAPAQAGEVGFLEQKQTGGWAVSGCRHVHTSPASMLPALALRGAGRARGHRHLAALAGALHNCGNLVSESKVSQERK